jgi:signal transduction histidine kinase
MHGPPQLTTPEDREVITLAQSARTASGLGMFAFTSFALVDPWVTTTTPLGTLWATRTVIVILLGALGALTFHPRWKRRSSLWTALACVVTGLGVIAVTVMVGGADSYYHEALLLTYLGYALLPMPWRLWHYLMLYGGLTLTWLVAILVTETIGTTGQTVTAFSMLCVATVIATTLATLSRRMRERDRAQQATIAEANDRLQELDRAKTRFFANLSHEFRTPLTLALAPLESMLEAADGSLTEVQRRHIGLARRSCLRLLRMVDDLLALNRLEAASLPLQPIPLHLGQTVERLACESQPLAQRKNIRLVLAIRGADLRMVADADAVERVFLNLLANALHFTRPGGRVVCRVEETPDGLLLAVDDSGVGITEDQLPRIFDRFHQAPGPATQAAVGTGIGLALARELVEAHGGRIEVASVVGEGTSMQVFWKRGDVDAAVATPPSLPRPADEVLDSAAETGMPEWHAALRSTPEYRLLNIDRATERRRTPRADREDGGRSRILIVEDNTDLVRYIGEVLSARYHVMSATDGVAALELANRFVPDLILCDLMMPGMSGFEVLQQLRAGTVTRAIPIVVLSARQDVESRAWARTQGADAFLAKPFHMSELMATLDALLANTGRRSDQVRRESLDVMHGLARCLESLLTGVAAQDASGLVVFQQRVQDLLDTRLEEPTPASLDDTLHEAVRQWSPPAEVTLELRPQTPTPLLLRARASQRAIRALLDNAAEAAGPGGRVLVQTEYSADGDLLVQVEDSGPGVPVYLRERVVQAFYTTGDPARHFGLGLPLAREVAKAHGGGLTLSDGRRLPGARATLRLSRNLESSSG